jgi:hypothetical protein
MGPEGVAYGKADEAGMMQYEGAYEGMIDEAVAMMPAAYVVAATAAADAPACCEQAGAEPAVSAAAHGAMSEDGAAQSEGARRRAVKKARRQAVKKLQRAWRSYKLRMRVGRWAQLTVELPALGVAKALWRWRAGVRRRQAKAGNVTAATRVQAAVRGWLARAGSRYVWMRRWGGVCAADRRIASDAWVLWLEDIGSDVAVSASGKRHLVVAEDWVEWDGLTEEHAHGYVELWEEQEQLRQQVHEEETATLAAVVKGWDLAWRRLEEGERVTVEGIKELIEGMVLHESRMHLTPADAVLDAMEAVKVKMKADGVWSKVEGDRWEERREMMLGMVLSHDRGTLQPEIVVTAMDRDGNVTQQREEWSRVKSYAELRAVKQAERRGAVAGLGLVPRDRLDLERIQQSINKDTQSKEEGWEEEVGESRQLLHTRTQEAERRVSDLTVAGARAELVAAELQRDKMVPYYGGSRAQDGWQKVADKGVMPSLCADVGFWREAVGRLSV